MTEQNVVVSAEHTACLDNGIDLSYQTFGDPTADPLLLVMGLGGPMIWWDDELCAQLARAGFFVIRYDNRDTGHSTRPRSGRITRGTLMRAFVGRPVTVPYSLQDMADDDTGLLDHLGLESAHVVGISMGGMIAQTMALSHPERVRSLTSIMSTTGRRTVGWQNPRLIPRLLQPAPGTVEEYIESNAAFWKLIGSPAYPFDTDDLTQRAYDTWDRGTNPAGVLRQMLAILTQPDRSEALHDLRTPTLVIHGLNDRMVHVSGGRATAKARSSAARVTRPLRRDERPVSRLS